MLLTISVGFYMAALCLMMLFAPAETIDGDEWNADKAAGVVGVSLLIFCILVITGHGVR